MKLFRNIYFWAAVALLFVSCEREITVDLPQAEPKIVVEGYIFQGERPYVIVSRNASYFAPIDSLSIINTFITNATVTVSDGTITETLTFAQAPESALGFAYVSNSPTLFGQVGKTYTLTVVADGQTVTSTTTVLPPVPLDSTQWRKDGPLDSLGLVWLYFKDPGTDDRGYRILSRRVSANELRNEPLFRTNFEFSNRFFLGQQIPVGIGRADQFAGQETADTTANGNDKDKGRYRIGDTVEVRLCPIDFPYYNFLNSLGSSLNSGGPFASPNNVQSNVTGGLGGWGGHGVTQITVICQP